MTRQFQVGQELSLMKCCQLFNRLYFHDYCVFYQQVDPVAAVQMDAFVSDRELNLTQREARQTSYVDSRRPGPNSVCT